MYFVHNVWKYSFLPWLLISDELTKWWSDHVLFFQLVCMKRRLDRILENHFYSCLQPYGSMFDQRSNRWCLRFHTDQMKPNCRRWKGQRSPAMRLRSCLITVSMSFCLSLSIFLKLKTLFFLLISFILEIQNKGQDKKGLLRETKQVRWILVKRWRGFCAVSIVVCTESLEKNQQVYSCSLVWESKKCKFSGTHSGLCVCVCVKCHKFILEFVFILLQHCGLLRTSKKVGGSIRPKKPQQGASSWV